MVLRLTAANGELVLDISEGWTTATLTKNGESYFCGGTSWRRLSKKFQAGLAVPLRGTKWPDLHTEGLSYPHRQQIADGSEAIKILGTGGPHCAWYANDLDGKRVITFDSVDFMEHIELEDHERQEWQSKLRTLRPQDSFPPDSWYCTLARRAVPANPSAVPVWTNHLGMDFVWCPPGTFEMGSPDSEEGRGAYEKLHTVTLTKGFWLARYPMTQLDWRLEMITNPSDSGGAPLDDRCPVNCVPWDDVLSFIEGWNSLDWPYEYRLPTEAEWEYACRAGTTGPRYGDLDQIAWYADSGTNKMPQPVGLKQPNAFGLYDMLGNVCEWCQDWFDEYPDSPVTDPTGPTGGYLRVLRGGASFSSADECRAAARITQLPDEDSWRYGGIRLVVTGPPPP